MALSLVSTVNAMVTIGPRYITRWRRTGRFSRPRRGEPALAHAGGGDCVPGDLLDADHSDTVSRPVDVYRITLNFFASCRFLLCSSSGGSRAGEKLGVVSFAWPLVPAVFLLVGVWMTLFGMTLKPAVTLAAVLTVTTGAAVYHFLIRPAQAQKPSAL
jgi:APA family basic amino acid/polyamine antiporter